MILLLKVTELLGTAGASGPRRGKVKPNAELYNGDDNSEPNL